MLNIDTNAIAEEEMYDGFYAVCINLEKKLDEKYTCRQIISALQEMNFLKFEGKGYIPTYTRTELTDALHNTFGFNTSKEIIPIKK